MHQQIDLNANLKALPRECDILIETKITSALLLLENAIKSHQSKGIRRILKTTGGALLEIGKSLISPSIANVLLGSSGAMLKTSELIDTQVPSNHIASFVYKLREKSY